MRALLAILVLALASCGGNPTAPDERPISEPPIAEPPTSGPVTLDLSGTVTGPDVRVASGMTVQYKYCYCVGDLCFMPTCDFHNETVTGSDGRYTLTQPWCRCTFDRPVRGVVLAVRGSANGECWRGESEEPIICTNQPQTLSVRLHVASSPGSC
mgnify:CR=1 FL=1